MTGPVLAATHSIPVKGDKSQLSLVEETRGGLRYHVEVGTIEALDVATREGDFTRLLIPGFHNSQVDGSPELPMMNRLISIPIGAEARVEVVSQQTRTIRLADFGIANALMPHQPSLSKSADPATVPFLYNRAAYGQSKVEQPLARVVYEGRLRAMDIGRLEISPVRYLPGSGEIEVVESLELSVTFPGADEAAAEQLRASTWSPFFQNMYAMMDGNRGFHDNYPDQVRDVVTMVIVTPPEFQAQLQTFIQWKTDRGFHMITGVIGSPEVGTTTTSIQTYIRNLYNAGTPELPAPSFVLFVGDVAQCPTWQVNGDATDRPYCAIGADYVPDIYYGRFSAVNASQLQAQIDKTLMYDQFTMPDPSYLSKVVMIAGYDASYGALYGNGQINYGTSTYFNAAHGIQSYTHLFPQSGSDDALVVSEVSAGVGYANYTAHGSETSWSDPTFTIANINSLQNNGKYLLAVGNCCLTSTYDTAECFGEAFLRAANKGAIGYIGGSNSTYWDEDYWWGVGYRSPVVVNPVYDATKLGAYDGVFHDHGEAEHLRYVTNDALVFAGNIAILQSGSSRIQYYWDIYNLLGDPSLSTYMGVPGINPVVHPATVFVGSPSITIQGDIGTYVGLTQSGVLVGSGTIGATGSVTIVYNQILTPGVPMKMVAMAQFKEPVIANLNVIVPATVLINPSTINANVTTPITVTVLDAGGTIPQAGVNVWAEGLNYATTPVMTNASGVAVITVNYPFGPTLDIVGKRPADSYRLFTQSIAVTALALTSPDLTVTTTIGMNDAFPLNLPGTLHATVGQPGCTLYARMPGGALLQSTTGSLTATATEAGNVVGMIAKSGYNLYTETFAVVEAYGTVAGTVTAGGIPLANVTVRCLDQNNAEVFVVTTNASGAWAAPEEILVDDYTLVVDHFGYLHLGQPVFVNYGANTFPLALTLAPSGVLSGHIYDSVTLLPLQGSVKVYRSDNGALYTETVSDASGYYATSALPYFTYSVRVRATHHSPVVSTVTMEESAVEKDWILAPTAGDLLLIDDGVKSAAYTDDKFVGKDNHLESVGYLAEPSKSVVELTADLETLGYGVTLVDQAIVDPATFVNYDLVILTCGANTVTLGNAALKTGLVNFARAGGHILLEGGELGYNQYGSGDFATYVMHTNDWNHDSSGNIQVPANATHAVATTPNNLAGTTIGLTYSVYGDADAMLPLADAQTVAVWSTYATDASVIAYDPNPAPFGGQMVFFCFNYAAAAAPAREQLLENAVVYLLTEELGNCAVSGTVHLQGESNHGGVTITATPNGGTTTTAADGSYTLPGLFAGPYTITATKNTWSSDAESVVLADGQHLFGVDFLLTPTLTSEYCESPAAPILDNQTTTDVLTIPAGDDASITSIEVYLNITHTYIGDLLITLTSPAGTAVVLHNRSGSSADNIVGWYPSQLIPAGNLGLYVGQQMAGNWTLTVADQAGGDVGTLNQWCLRIVHGSGQSTPVADLPTVFKAYANYPNPFNPRTTVRFDLPRTMDVSLRIYDVSGRLVCTLVDEVLPAATHSIAWDGQDDTGRRVASGVYYYRLIAGENSTTQKMMLVK
jgi:subtilisin-like proprotein convertase family protein